MLEHGERVQMGARVLASDGECGELARVIVNPVKQTLAHLVVAHRFGGGPGKLVPVDLVESVDEHHHIRLTCTVAQFRELDDAEDAQFLPAATDDLGYGNHALLWPYWSISPTSRRDHHVAMYSDRIPRGEVEVNRGDQVHASDGWVGAVKGLVIDPADEHVTHVLLEEGHLWGRKEVAIPIGAATRVDDVIRVDLTKQQVEELPGVELR